MFPEFNWNKMKLLDFFSQENISELKLFNCRTTCRQQPTSESTLVGNWEKVRKRVRVVAMETGSLI